MKAIAGDDLPPLALNLFLSCFLMRLKDKCALLRISKLRARLPPAALPPPEDRQEICVYISGWVLWRTKKEVWRNRKSVRNRAIQRCLKSHFSENGANATKITDPILRRWIDGKNRGKFVDGMYLNGLTVPSLEAYQFCSRLDNIMMSYECRDGLTSSMTLEAVLARVYDDVVLLDQWYMMTPDMEEAHQQSFLEFFVNVTRKLCGHANAKRLVRCLQSRRTIADRTNLKRNPTAAKKKKKSRKC